jgi:chromosome segregation ATPase
MLIGALLICLVGLGFFYWSVSSSKSELEAKHNSLLTQHKTMTEQHERVSRALGVAQNSLNNERSQRESDKASHLKAIESLKSDLQIQGEKMKKEAVEACEGKLQEKTDSAAMLQKKTWELTHALEELKASEDALKKEKERLNYSLGISTAKHNSAVRVIDDLRGELNMPQCSSHGYQCVKGTCKVGSNCSACSR